MKAKKTNKLEIIITVFLCLVCLSIGQIVQDVVQKQTNRIFIGYGTSYVISAVVYIALVYIMLTVICKKILHTSMKECRIGKLQIKLKWFIVAILLPLFVCGITLCFPGKMVSNHLSKGDMIILAVQQIVVYGIAGGIVEEMIFRGVIMSSIEKVSGKKWAIVIPSIIFAIGHMANATSVWGAIMILIAGICVGAMFSLVTYESDSIWCSVIIHVIWNASVLGQIISISTIQKKDAIYSYVIENTNLFTSSLQNIESSIIAIVGYCLILCYAIYCLKKNKVL